MIHAKRVILATFTAALLFCSPRNAFSQYQKVIAHLTLLPFGCKDTSEFHHLTYDQILANWSVKCKEPNCTVKYFTISFLPKGKEFLGPFPSSADDKDGIAIKAVKNLKEMHTASRIFVEISEVLYTGGGKKEFINVTKASAIISAAN